MFINIYKGTCLFIFTQTYSVYLYLQRHKFIYIYTDTCLFIFTQTPSVYLHIGMFINIYKDT